MDSPFGIRWTFSLRCIVDIGRLRYHRSALCTTVSSAIRPIVLSKSILIHFRLRRSKIRIILGDHDQFLTTEAPAKMRAVSAIIRHRNFDSNTYNHDIALLKLRKTVEFNKNIRPVCLPTSEADPAGQYRTNSCGPRAENWHIGFSGVSPI